MSANLVEQISRHATENGAPQKRQHLDACAEALVWGLIDSANEDGARTLHDKLKQAGIPTDSDPANSDTIATLIGEQREKKIVAQLGAKHGFTADEIGKSLQELLPTVKTVLSERLSGGTADTASALFSILRTQARHHSSPGPMHSGDCNANPGAAGSGGTAASSIAQNRRHYRSWLFIGLAIIALALIVRTFLLPATLDTGVSTRDSDGVDLNTTLLQTGNIDVGKELSVVHRGTSDALESVTDTASAQRAAVSLTHSIDAIKKLQSNWQTLPGESRTMASQLSADSARILAPLIERVMDNAEVAGILQQPLQTISDGLQSLASQ